MSVLKNSNKIHDCSTLKVEVIRPSGITSILTGDYHLQHWPRIKAVGFSLVNLPGLEMPALFRYWLLRVTVILFSCQSNLIHQIMQLPSRKDSLT